MKSNDCVAIFIIFLNNTTLTFLFLLISNNEQGTSKKFLVHLVHRLIFSFGLLSSLLLSLLYLEQNGT